MQNQISLHHVCETQLSTLNNGSLLLTKLWPPSLPNNLIERNLLISSRIHSEGHWCIYGSAGYGKTTLASMYCCNVAQNYGWLSLEENDNDAERFSLYLAAAFISACPDRNRFREMVQSQERLPLNQIITSILNEALLAEQPIVLVLDDYHLISNKDIHNGVSTLLNHASENFKIIITSRTRPPLSYSALHMRGRIHFTGIDELAFDDEKSIAYLNVTCPTISSSSLRSLVRAIDGWPAGLRSLELFFTNTGHLPDEISETALLTNTAISNYFWEQVLNKLPENLKIFLLRTSVLNTFDCDLCVEVTGLKESSLLLADTLDRQLFITCLDLEKKWFRYHHLFQAFLLKQLQSSHQEYESLHRRASKSWLMRGDVANALKHALTISDLTSVIKALLHPAQSLMAQGNGMLLEQAILMLPEDKICQHPNIIMLACSYWLNRNQDKVLQLIDIGCANLSKLKDQKTVYHLNARFNLYRAQIAIIRDQISHLIAWSSLALQDLPESDLVSCSQAYVLLAEGYTRNGDIHNAFYNWQKGEHLAARAGNPSLVAWARHKSALIELGLAAFSKAQKLQDEAIASAERDCFSGDRSLWCLYRARAETAWECFDLDAVNNYCKKSLHVCQHWPQSGEVPVEIIRARTQLLLGQQTQAYKHLHNALELAKTTPCSSCVKSYLALTQAEFHLRFSAKSALSQLLNSMETLESYSSDLSQRFGRAQAICHFGLGNFIQAIDILSNMNSDAKHFHLVTEEWRNNIWMAAVYLAKSQPQKAIGLINECVAFAVERGLVGSLLMTAPFLEPLFDSKVGLNEGDVRHWRRVHDLLSHSRAHAYKDHEVPEIIRALAITPKEWRVFDLVLKGAGNEEIALQLSLSLGTVKNTLTRIYRKLDVNDREMACRVVKQSLTTI